MSAEAKAPAIEEMSFEAALAELESIVDELDRGEVDLARSIEAYERGTALRQHCAKKLEEARMKVEQISKSMSGELEARPAELD